MIIDTNDIVKKFDFSSIITEQDNQDACKIIKSIIDGGNYFTNSPKYQTKENLLGRPEEIWLKYRMSFLFSVFMYLGKEAKVMNMMSWSFMTNLEGAEDRDKLWHHHWHPSRADTDMLSGIFYLDIPKDVADKMVRVASLIRNAYGEGKLGLTMSPRTLINWARKCQRYDTKYALSVAFTEKLTADDTKSVQEFYTKVFGD
jgi:hypothetical protein